MEAHKNKGKLMGHDINGLKRSYFKSVLTYTLTLLTAGLFYLCASWMPKTFWLFLTHSKCPIKEAEVILLIEKYQHKKISRISPIKEEKSTEEKKIDQFGTMTNKTMRMCHPKQDGTYRMVDSIRVIEVKLVGRKVRCIWKQGQFQPLKSMGHNLRITPPMLKGLTEEEHLSRLKLFGPNHIRVAIKSVWELLAQQMMRPVFFFKASSLVIWGFLGHFWRLGLGLFLSVFTISTHIYEEIKSQGELERLTLGGDRVKVYRNQMLTMVAIENLVPGDIIHIPPEGCKIYCDAVLLQGSCTVSETMLTGDTHPITKKSFITQHKGVCVLYDEKEHADNTLFAGTVVLETAEHTEVKALVTSTGFLTRRGAIVAGLMYPPPVRFSFTKELKGLILIMASVGLISMIVKLSITLSHEWDYFDLFTCLDMLTICVPPALEDILVGSVRRAQRWLRSSGTTCTSPRSLVVSGSVNVACFDKTGTMTVADYEKIQVVPALHGRFLDLIDKATGDVDLNIPELVLMATATCHSISFIKNEMTGSSLERHMFDFSSASIRQPTELESEFSQIISWPEGNGPGWELGICQKYPFTSALARMGVICRRTDRPDQMEFFCKGSCSVLRHMCVPGSLPPDFDEICDKYARKGKIVLALAHRSFKASINVYRGHLEQQLTFLGFICFENKIKPDTSGVIHHLTHGGIKTVVLTSDNLATAIHVARKTKMVDEDDRIVVCSADEPDVFMPMPRLRFHVDEKTLEGEEEYVTSTFEGTSTISLHLALTGYTWSVIRHHYPEMLGPLLSRATIFAGMTPLMKQQVVEELKRLDYVVAMCGNGSNDNSAMAVADCGVVLCNAEGSASAAFTSERPSIKCVTEVIRHGRCVLATLVGDIKYVVTYSVMRLCAIWVLYSMNTAYLNDGQLFTIEVIFLILITLSGMSHPSTQMLSFNFPRTSIVSLNTISSLLLQFVGIIGFQLLCLMILRQQQWFINPVNGQVTDLGHLAKDRMIRCFKLPFRTSPQFQAGVSPITNSTEISAWIPPVWSLERWVSVYKPFYSPQNFGVFLITMSQCILYAMLFSSGAPFKENIYKKPEFFFLLLSTAAFIAYMSLNPSCILIRFFSLQNPPDVKYRLELVALILGQILVATVIEWAIVNYILEQFRYSAWWSERRPEPRKYLKYEDKWYSEDDPESNSKTDFVGKVKTVVAKYIAAKGISEPSTDQVVEVNENVDGMDIKK